MTATLRHGLFAALVAILLLAAVTPGTALSPEEAYDEALTDRLLDRIEDVPPEDRVHVIVETNGPNSQVMPKAEALGFEVEWTYSIIDAFSGWVKKADLPTLAKQDGVTLVWDAVPYQPLLEDSAYVVRANEAWDAGFTGEGVSVAVLDTGVDMADPLLAGNLNLSECKSFIAGVETPECQDFNGHGTHVAATVASDHPTYRGVAPDAEIAALRVLHGGVGSSADTIAAMDWVAGNHTSVEPNIKVINLSLGPLVPSCGDGTSPSADAVERSVAAGMTVVVAAGNSGHSECTVDGAAAAPSAITVGAVDDQDTDARDDVEMWGSSSAGPTLDDRQKPEIVAPGVSVTSLFPGPFIATMSGTSMASPHVAGAAALVHAKEATLEPLDVREMIMDTAYDPPNAPANLPECGPWGWGLVDIGAMFENLTGPWDPAEDPCPLEDDDDSTSPKEPVTQSKAYILSGQGLTILRPEALTEGASACEADSSVGGATFCTDGGFTTLDATITDDAGLPVPATVSLKVDGDSTELVPFCGTLVDETIGTDIGEATVYLGQTLYALLGGPPCLGEGTQGVIDVTWS